MPTRRKVFSPPPPLVVPAPAVPPTRFGHRAHDWQHIWQSGFGGLLALLGVGGHVLAPEHSSDVLTLGLVVVGCTLIHPTALRDLVRSWRTGG